MKKTLLILTLWTFPAAAQDPMSLKDAVQLALKQNKAVEASAAARSAAESRIVEARSGKLPKVNYAESWTRSDNPVFVFSSLLTQHQFSAQNFELGSLESTRFPEQFSVAVYRGSAALRRRWNQARRSLRGAGEGHDRRGRRAALKWT